MGYFQFSAQHRLFFSGCLTKHRFSDALLYPWSITKLNFPRCGLGKQEPLRCSFFLHQTHTDPHSGKLGVKWGQQTESWASQPYRKCVLKRVPQKWTNIFIFQCYSFSQGIPRLLAQTSLIDQRPTSPILKPCFLWLYSGEYILCIWMVLEAKEWQWAKRH